MTADTAGSASSGSPGVLQRVFGPTVDAVIAPGRAFDSLEDRPRRALWPLVWVLAGMVFLGLWTLDTTRQIMRAGMVEGMSRQGQQPDPEQFRGMLETMDRFAYLWAIGGSLFVVVTILFVAAALWMGAALLGGRTDFGRSFAVASVSAVIHPFLHTAFVSLVWTLEPPEIRRLEDFAAARPSLGLDLLVGGDPTSFLQVLLSRVDLFNLWWVVVAVIGAERMLGLKRAGAVSLAVVIWLVSAVMAAAWAGFGS